MSANQLFCPYCKELLDPHSFGQLDFTNQVNCPECDNQFSFKVDVSFTVLARTDIKPVQKRAYIGREIAEKIGQYCFAINRTKDWFYSSVAMKTGVSKQSVKAAVVGSVMANESIVAEMCRTMNHKYELHKGAHRESWIISKIETKETAKTAETAPQYEDFKHLVNQATGFITFKYQIGHQSPVEETRKMSEADISAYLDRLSKKHRDCITNKPLPVELISVNGVKIQEKVA